MRIILLLVCCIGYYLLPAQKMLVLEKANRAETVKMFAGETLRFRMKGKEDYWYQRTITDILPESKTLLLDNFPVKVDSIAAIKMPPKQIWRLLGGTFIAFGASLTLATTVGKFLYNDKDVNAPKLYGIAAVSLAGGWALSKTRKLKLGKKYRLRIIEIKFPDPLIPPPPGLKH